MQPLPAPRIKNRVVNLLPGQPFRAPCQMVRSAQINLFLSPNGLVGPTRFFAPPAAGSHCQRACFKGTKKPIGVFNLDRRPVARPPCFVAAREASLAPPHRSTFFVKFFHFFQILPQPVGLQELSMVRGLAKNVPARTIGRRAGCRGAFFGPAAPVAALAAGRCRGLLLDW